MRKSSSIITVTCWILSVPILSCLGFAASSSSSSSSSSSFDVTCRRVNRDDDDAGNGIFRRRRRRRGNDGEETFRTIGARVVASTTAIERNDNDDDDDGSSSRGGWGRRLRASARRTFLPVTSSSSSSIPPSFVRYCALSCAQDLSTQLRSVLATQRLLEGVGVGREGATALSASIHFMVRDGFGMLSSLAFTSRCSPSFSRDLKRWRFFADVAVDVGITLEVVAARLPPAFFLPALCLGNGCKAVCGVAAGACGGGLASYWAGVVGAPLTEIHAKLGAQSTATALLGLAASASLAGVFHHAPSWASYAAYAALTALHLRVNASLLSRSVVFDHLNTVRFDVAAIPYVETWWRRRRDGGETSPLAVDAPSVVARVEPLTFLPRPRSRAASVALGRPFRETVSRDGDDDDGDGGSLDAPLTATATHAARRDPATGVVAVALRERATPRDVARARLEATLSDRSDGAATPEERAACWEDFARDAAAAGWDLDRTDLDVDGYAFECRDGTTPPPSSTKRDDDAERERPIARESTPYVDR